MAEPVKPRKNWIFATSNLNIKRKGRRRKCLNLCLVPAGHFTPDASSSVV